MTNKKRNTILVLSGKGGVGKSTVSTNLALALAMNDSKVGLLDADIYGPSIPTMMGVQEPPTLDDDQKIIPIQSHGIEMMSSGFLVEPDQALIWRGPMVHKIVQQFCNDVAWSDLDFLVVDLPPGTGDVQLSISQTISVVGAVVVTTPQKVALDDVKRATSMLESLKIPLLGVIENMSGFLNPATNEIVPIFSAGGGEQLAKDLDCPLFGAIPIDPNVCTAGDQGKPVFIENPSSPASKMFFKIAQKVVAQISKFNHDKIQSEVVQTKV